MESLDFVRTAGLGLAPWLAVVRASSSAQSACTCRWSAAGLKGLYSLVSLVFTAFLTVSVSARALVWGCRCVVLLTGLHAVTDLLDEFVLRGEVVRQQPLQLPDPVQQFQLGRGVVAVVPDGLAHNMPVLLLHMRPVVLVNVNSSCSHQRNNSQLMNSLPLSELMPRFGNGNSAVAALRAAKTHFWALFFPETVSVQPA